MKQQKNELNFYQNSSKKQKKNNETVREEGVTICGKMQRIYLKS